MRFALVLAIGCGGGGDDGDGTDAFPRACDESQVDGDCVLFTGSAWVAADVQEACEGGTLLDACPATGAAVGTCTDDGGADGFETVTTFYTPFYDGQDALYACNGAGGTFAGT